jgi:hypothetical protein
MMERDGWMDGWERSERGKEMEVLWMKGVQWLD